MLNQWLSLKRLHRSAGQGTEYGELLAGSRAGKIETAGAGSWGGASRCKVQAGTRVYAPCRWYEAAAQQYLRVLWSTA